MTRAQGARRVTPVPRAATVFGAIIASELIASSAADTGARLLAIQRIRSRASAQLDAASLSHNGRFVAFVARTTDSRERSCCQHVYVLDRSGGALAEVAPEGALLLGDNVLRA